MRRGRGAWRRARRIGTDLRGVTFATAVTGVDSSQVYFSLSGGTVPSKGEVNSRGWSISRRPRRSCPTAGEVAPRTIVVELETSFQTMCGSSHDLNGLADSGREKVCFWQGQILPATTQMAGALILLC